jgi:CBS domain-containing protein/ribosomal protein S27AE|tara:strand:- start:3474 stop:4034 length:561 start_codon:yes stop_codon:yes gene_type:complete
MKNIFVSDIMTQEVITIKPSTNLFECAKIMVRKKTRSIPIVDNKKLIGFISEKDVLWALVKKTKEDLSEIKVTDVSSKKVITIKPNATIEEAIAKIRKTKFNKIPVVQKNELVGIITTKDILNFHPEIYPELEEFAQIKEREEKLKKIKIKKGEIINEGFCEKCGEKTILKKVNERMVCGSCINSM